MSIFTLPLSWYIFYRLIHGQKPSVRKPLVGNLFLVEIFIGKKKNLMTLQMDNVSKTKNYPLEYTDKIILSVIGNGIWSNFIPILCKISTK
jgi:hypothetical protein